MSAAYPLLLMGGQRHPATLAETSLHLGHRQSTLGLSEDLVAALGWPWETESGTETYRPASGGSRVKSDGKSVRPTAVTQRRLNPTWSKAK